MRRRDPGDDAGRWVIGGTILAIAVCLATQIEPKAVTPTTPAKKHDDKPQRKRLLPHKCPNCGTTLPTTQETTGA